MDKKVEKFLNRYCDDGKFYLKCLGIFILCFIIIFATIFTCNKNYYYPENEYTILENEVNKIIETKDLKTDYKCVITHYDFSTNNLKFELLDKNENLVKVEVEDVKASKWIANVKRDKGSLSVHIFLSILLTLYYSCVSGLFFSVIFFIIILVILVIYKKIKKKE